MNRETSGSVVEESFKRYLDVFPNSNHAEQRPPYLVLSSIQSSVFVNLAHEGGGHRTAK